MLRILQNVPLPLLLCREPFTPSLPCHWPRDQGAQTPVQGATASVSVCAGPGGMACSCLLPGGAARPEPRVAGPPYFLREGGNLNFYAKLL